MRGSFRTQAEEERVAEDLEEAEAEMGAAGVMEAGWVAGRVS